MIAQKFSVKAARLMDMLPLPWRYIASWDCVGCGRCCRDYDVVLRFDEWVNIVRTYGVVFTEPRIDRLYMKRREDGTCVFLYKFFDRWLCGLQFTKPRACKLWPFKIYAEPKYGRPKEAVFSHGEDKFFVYVDPACEGISWGTPTQEYMHKTLPEFVEIGLGVRNEQRYSTSKIPYQPAYVRAKERQRFWRPPPLI